MNAQQIMQSVGAALAEARRAGAAAQNAEQSVAGLRQELARQVQAMQGLAAAMQKAEAVRSGGLTREIQRVEDIPGRRIPFDLLVDIPIGANVTSVQQGSLTISQEGPFVAVARFAAFLSTYEFQLRDPTTGTLSTFSGRSFGRYRPIASAWDFGDGKPVTQIAMAVAAPGTGAPHVTSPTTLSAFRSMQPDYRIKFENAGSSFPRTNLEVPSMLWNMQINDPFPLGALDVFERGEVLTFKVLPLHANNAAFGNLNGFGAPNPNFPFIDAGWDAVEGINDTNDAAAADVDPITRLPNGILTIGYHGYRIVQPAGAGPY